MAKTTEATLREATLRDIKSQLEKVATNSRLNDNGTRRRLIGAVNMSLYLLNHNSAFKCSSLQPLEVKLVELNMLEAKYAKYVPPRRVPLPEIQPIMQEIVYHLSELEKACGNVECCVQTQVFRDIDQRLILTCSHTPQQ